MAQMSDLMFEIVAADRTRAAFDSAGKNADGLAAKAANAGRATKTGMDAASGSVSNLAAQFSDIGVQLAGGQSPFLIALQQGSQINGVLGQAGAAGAVSLLGGAFASLLNPVSLATIAIIGLGGTAVQYFADLMSSGDQSAEVLKEQAELIDAVAKQWGDAVPALQAYVDELARVKENTDLIAATDVMASQQWAPVKDQVQELGVLYAAMHADLQQFDRESELIRAFEDAWTRVNAAVEQGTVDQQAMAEMTSLLSQAIDTGIPSVEAFDSAFNGLSQSIAGAARQAQIFRDQALQALTTGKNGPALGTLSPLFSEGGTLYSASDFMPSGNVPRPTGRGTPELSGFPGENSRAGGRRRTGKTELEREAEAYEKLIQSLEDEKAMIGANRAEQRALQLQRRANVDATSEQGRAITSLVAQIEEERSAYQQAEKAGRFMRDNLRDAFMDLIPEIETGNKALDGFINRLIQASAEALFFGSGPFGGSGGGLFGSLFSFGGPRAVGGAVEPFRDYMVGENGPEIVRIGSAGGRVGAFGGGGGGNAPVQVNIINNAASTQVTQTQRNTAGGKTIDVQIDDLNASKINQPGSATRSAMQSQFGLKAPLRRA